MKNNILFYFIIVLLLGACKDDSTPPTNDDTKKLEVYEANYSRFDIQDNDEYESAYNLQVNTKVKEISGIVIGRSNQDYLYTHEDGNNSSAIFVFNKLGQLKGRFLLIGVNNRDWEDIAIGPGPVDGENYIYVGDIGDNSAVRSSLRVYRFLEPKITPQDTSNVFIKNITDFEIIDFKYPDSARDAETLMVDMHSKDLIIVSKRDPQVRVYTLSYPQKIGEMNTAEFRGFLPLKRMIAGDISEDNSKILMKDDGAIYLWNVENNNPVKTLFNQMPTRVAYIPEEQGEAVGWDKNDGYFTLSESRSNALPFLYYYRKK